VRPKVSRAGHGPADALAGSILTRDITVDGERWPKGRRLTAADLGRLVVFEGAVGSLLFPDEDDLHEDEAALRLAAAVGGPNLEAHAPVQSRVDLLATANGVLHVRIAELERLNRIDPLEVFTALDGQVVEAGRLVASVKVAPHLVPATIVQAGERIAWFGRRPLVWVAPFLPMRVAVVVKESIHAPARQRFEASVRAKIESLGSEISSFEYVDDDAGPVKAAIASALRSRPRPDLVLTAGGRSTDPADPFFVAIEALGGRIVRRGVPAHPGSMLWLGRVGRTGIVGLPTCGAYSKATAADLVLPRLLTGEPVTERTVAPLGHGGILTRDMRFRFPAYARELEAPEG
jgi:molybdenum cofactor cytidylyltransferase